MRSLKSLLGLPNPVDAGWSDCDALGSEIFGLAPGQKSWEQFDAHLKATYPVRAFFAITLTDWFFSTVWYPSTRPIKDAHYWLVSHIVPSRRYHMLDLRQKNGHHKYTHGWIDADTQMEYAMFNILNAYVEKEKPWVPTEEDVANEPNEWGEQDCLRVQRDRALEVMAIYEWWNVTRPKMERGEDGFESEKEAMMIRLIKVRRSMWT